jgi:M6 family metalloprotease-like protein
MKNIYRIFLKILTVILFTTIQQNIQAAYLENVPVTMIQPDGTKLHCFASGDEYYSWLHDQNNYTIIQNHQNGYYVYAVFIDGELTPTPYVAGKTDPAKAGLIAGANISADKKLALRNEFWKNTPKVHKVPNQHAVQNGPQQGINIGTMNNIVVFIRFSGEAEYTDLNSVYDNMFNGTAGSNTMKNFFEEVSNNTLHINTTFYPTPGGTVVKSFQDSHPRNYYQKYDATTNPTGYQNDRTAREQTLLKDAINSVSSQIDATGLNFDYDNDGRIDNVCFIISGTQDGWSDLLWPHRWSLYSVTANIGSKKVWDYNFQLKDFLTGSGVGVLAHEMFHSLGSPDLYHYNTIPHPFSPVGAWDLMESTKNPPEHMLTYMKYRYGNWLTGIPEILASGTYTLNPTTSTTNTCYKIASPNSLTEYFVVEYRRKQGTFESSIPGSGLIIYRINTLKDGDGNAQGPPDEVYIYRPDGNDTTNGNISNAFYSSGSGRVHFGKNTNPECFLSNLNDGGIDISNVTAAGSTISFTVNIIGKPSVYFTPSTNNTCVGKKVTLNDLSAAFPNKWEWSITPKTFTYTDATDSSSKNPVVIFTADGIYDVTLKASNKYGDSSLTKQNCITIGTGVSVPFNEDWETNSFNTNSWTIDNPDSATTWEIFDKASKPDSNTQYSVQFFGFEYQAKREKDDLISRNINLNNVNYAKLKFDISYCRYDNNTYDSLLVYVSTDCGNTFDSMPVYFKSGANLATGPNSTQNYIPTFDSDWRKDSVDLSSYSGNNIVFKFRMINDYGNNLYLDNINVSAANLTTFTAEADNSKICVNDTVKFHDKSTGSFTSRIWSFPGGTPSTSGLANPKVVYSTPGKYKANLTKIISGFSRTSTIDITVNELPATPIIIENYGKLTSSAASSYQWYDSTGKAIAGATGQSYSPAKSGNVYVIIKNANGCSASSIMYDFNTSIREIGRNVNMIVYPNPNNGSFTLNISGDIISTVRLTIQNSLGQTVYSVNDLKIKGNYSEIINMNKMVPGMYHLVLTNKEGQSVTRFFVE